MSNNSFYSSFFSKSLIKDGIANYDYIDVFSKRINNPKHNPVDYISAEFFSYLPWWMRALTVLRNFLVKPFNLKGEHSEKLEITEPVPQFEIGDKVVMFHVCERNEKEIITGEEDTHLNFRTGLLWEQVSGDEYELFSSTLVVYNNFFGKFYFFFVKRFHKIMVKSTLNALAKRHK